MLGRPWPDAGEPLFTREDTDYALALDQVEQAEAAEKCPLCGLPVSLCRDPANQFRFAAAREQCHASWAIAAEQAKFAKDAAEADVRSTAWSAQLKTTPSTRA